MKKSPAAGNLLKAAAATVLLLYFMIKSQSPKIIFIPFLVCSLSMAGKSIAGILNKEKMEFVFGKLFILGFLMFFIGFLVVASCTSIREKSLSLLILTIPFWIAGIILIKKKL